MNEERKSYNDTYILCTENKKQKNEKTKTKPNSIVRLCFSVNFKLNALGKKFNLNEPCTGARMDRYCC